MTLSFSCASGSPNSTNNELWHSAALKRCKTHATLGSKPEREVVTPYPDVASGRYQQAECAADLWQVYRASFSPEIRQTVSDEDAATLLRQEPDKSSL